MFSCNNENTEANSTEPTAEVCEYSINNEGIKFIWTAFKTTAKIGVNGSFDKLKVSNNGSSTEIPALILNTKIKIALASINSDNPERDAKLVESFFGKLANTESFTGIVQECNGDNNSGNLVVLLNINKIDHAVAMTYTFADDLLEIAGTLDLLDWKAEDALESLNQACLDLHKGDDGVSKTWSDMEIKVLVPLKKVCE